MTPYQRAAIDILSRSPMFEGLDAGALQAMAAALAPERWPKRCVVTSPDAMPGAFHVILGGRVKITRHNPKNGREVTLFLLGPGDGFGGAGFPSGLPANASAQTLEPVNALSGPMELWRSWLEIYPSFRHGVCAYVNHRLTRLADLASDLALHDGMTRLAHLLLRHCHGPTPTPDVPLIADLPHEELAHMIGTVRVVVNRLLGDLKREGIVEMQGGKLRVLDVPKLLQIAERHASFAPRKEPARPVSAPPQ